MDASERFECDLLVIGAGMAGLSAAARAAQDGAKVIVVEKAQDIGGSAMLSGGLIWTVASTRKLRCLDDGDPELGAVVVDGYAQAIGWLRARGVQMSAPREILYGRGYQIDIAAYLRSCVASITQAAGAVMVNTVTKRLLTDGQGRVIGADAVHRNEPVRVLAKSTILATGGFQASADLRAAYIHPHARNMPLRSNPCSTGDGLHLGMAAGGSFAGSNPGFYGHLHCYPAATDCHSNFGLITQYHSEAAVLLNKSGQRFCDESLVDHLNAQETLTQTDSLALLVWDQRTHEEHVLKEFVKGLPPVDKLEVALTNGAWAALCPTLDDVARHASEWGFDGAAVRATLMHYSHSVRTAPETLRPGRVNGLQANDTPPFRALVVQPAITFTHAGLATDSMAHALDARGRPVPGLLVAGADVGNVYRRGYAGGLAAALTFGLRAAQTSVNA
jgi:succinate dehydrogenase/fumarate reductase flavoprotein subunit